MKIVATLSVMLILSVIYPLEFYSKKPCSYYILLLTSSFIEKYGTHVVVGVKMGGKDTVYVKQQHSSLLESVDVQKNLKEMADKMFVDGTRLNISNADKFYEREKV